MQTLFFALLFSVTTLLFHAVGLEASLYWSQWWFDLVAHLLGGVSLGIFIPFFFPQRYRFLSLFFLLLLVISWEVFEVFVLQIAVEAPTYLTDTIVDVVIGFVSGAFAFHLFYRR